MTALEQYDRLETTAVWRTHDDPDGREVLITFGNATLTLSGLDNTGDTPLAHWSLPALHLRGSTEKFDVYSADNETDETLTIEDATMREALAKVLGERVSRVEQPVPKSKWPRIAIFAVFLGAAIYSAPGIIAGLAKSLVSPEREDVVASDMINMIEDRTGPKCAGGQASAALDTIAKHLLSDNPPKVHIADLGDATVMSLGRHVVLDRRLVERMSSVEELAGWISIGIARGRESNAVQSLFENNRLSENISFLATGDLSDALKARAVTDALNQDDEAEGNSKAAILLLDQAAIARDDFLHALERENIPVRYAHDTNSAPARPLLDDTEWVAIQNMCNG